MGSVETEAYKIPERYMGLHTLAYWECLSEGRENGNFSELPQLAGELGFTRAGDLTTKRHRRWDIYDRPNHEIPNFPDGVTRINSTLAVYNTEEQQTQAFLRTSPQPYPAAEFAKVLEAFTQHYIERPRLSIFPSRELTRGGGLVIATLAGAAVGGAVDYSIVQTVPGSITNLGLVMVGEVGAAAFYSTMWTLSEISARRQISHPEQYTAGDGARNVLLTERYHIVTVAVQKELYQALQQEGAEELTPDQFLNKIYRQIPQALINRRRAEVELSVSVGNSLPKMLEVARILQQVATHLNAADELKRGLAQG